ncbi:D-ribose pyranase [Demequina sp.]|uniref:D-ribose pyranase n=1 Tax=Demequina sp. TaxID=2050685 RepID=UPI0025C5E0DA|nr:D-ribose pyranase [Demequina sp.]
MKRTGIINAPLSGALARLGHTDTVVVADAGLPVPAHVPVVDLALVYGSPRFTDVLDALLGDIVVEAAWVSQQADDWPAGEWIDTRLDAPAERIDHAEFKRRVSDARLVIRTGEDTAFSNVILQCGVPFAV